ncbi:tripartite tricarboxylate transporter substrate binding protein [Sediminicoccus sp. KRV36]|uniref:Bug family tripartite tricarboxylate transporter substrate binding protein n=1 Tax=Sediminicoccus sp. KRV36 TaxID=3133721 RepID=UPI00200CA43B|nr:tripartite tricarboxylate transporter substrate binding protein [Sediminicoccus rosea]UPY35986.1 tripartite tricarboxylate transporter substrate binding protein [Sediminicoccus rosea]
MIAATRRAAMLGALAMPSLARAAWPERSIRLLVPYGGGGQTDIVSRVTAEALTQRLGQIVLADNRPGGAGNLAAETLARAPADGYTLMVATMGTNSGINALMYRALGYDWERDFAPIGQFCATSNVLLVHNSIPATGFPELIAWIRANPGRFTYASAGVGAITHLIMEDLGARLGLEMVHVPYRQSTQAMTDLLSGRVHARCLGLPEGETVRGMQSIRAVAVTSAERRENWPGVPTMAETVPGFVGSSYFGLTARAGTPPEAIARISEALNDALGDPRVQGAYARVGADPAPPHTPADFQRVIRAAHDQWAPLIRRLNLVAE